MTRRTQRGVLAAVVGVLFLFTLPGFADSLARIVRLSEVEGSVEVDRHSGQGFERAILNMPITQEMLIRTGTDGRAEVEFEDGIVVRLTPLTQIGLPQLSLRSSGAKVSTVQLDEGVVYFSVQHYHEDDELTIVAAQRQIPVTHSGRFRVAVTGTNVKLAVLSGEIEVAQGDKQVKVKKGKELTLASDGGEMLAENFEPNSYDSWDKTRADYHDQYYNGGGYGSYPYYGRGDLSYYGNWYNLPGYGPLWQPYNAGLGWSPFSYGYWSWYPGCGYTWVSGYPWGWLPYRFGAWTWVPGWGWGWMPGSRWGGWRPVPLIVRAPNGFVAPRPPALPNRPITAVGTGPNRPRYPFPDLLHDHNVMGDRDNPRAPIRSDEGMRTHVFTHTVKPPAVRATPAMGMLDNGGGAAVRSGATITAPNVPVDRGYRGKHPMPSDDRMVDGARPAPVREGAPHGAQPSRPSPPSNGGSMGHPSGSAGHSSGGSVGHSSGGGGHSAGPSSGGFGSSGGGGAHSGSGASHSSGGSHTSRVRD
jgi:hypothetical protein